MKVLQSAEDYLEKILMIKNEKGNVRAIDIANEMNFSKPSVSIAMKKLKENGFIEIEENGLIVLTEEGYKIAAEIYERHEVISSWLIKIGVNADQAKEDACKMEHTLSEETFAALKKYITK